MMPPKRDHRTLIDAAKLYYVEGLDQGSVAKRLGVSRSSVSRMLATARAEGLVQVRIVGDSHAERNKDLEAELIRRFRLREVLVAQATSNAEGSHGVAELASEVFLRRAPSATRIGFSWGLAVGALIDAIPAEPMRNDTRVTPLVGGMPTLDTGLEGNTYVQLLADKIQAIPERFDAPAIVESPQTHAAMMSESTIQSTLARVKTSELAFVGVGSFGVHTSRHVLAAMKLNEMELAQVLASSPVGDMVGRYFDINGTPLGPPASQRVIGITIEDLAAIDCTVAIASSQEKTRGVLGALRTNAVDVLVVDEPLAVGLLALSNH